VADLFVAESKIAGKGMFAARGFAKGETVIEFGGIPATYEEIEEKYKHLENYFLQVDENRYLGPSGNFDDFLNHSCDPNAGMVLRGGKALLVAIKDIPRGEEVTMDFSTTMDEDDWELDCVCGSKNCRKRIRDFKYLPREIQEKYVAAGVVPDYVAKKIRG